MKKTYISPKVNIVRCNMPTLAANSVGVGASVNDITGAEARRSGVNWDDFDDDFYED